MPPVDVLEQDLIQIYETASQRLLSTLNGSFRSNRRTVTILRQIDAILAELSDDTRSIVDDLVPQAYRDGSAEIVEGIELNTDIPPADIDVSFGLVDRDAVRAIAEQAFIDLNDGLSSARKSISNIIQRTQLNPALDRETMREVGINIAKGGTRRELSNRLKSMMREGFFSVDEVNDLLDALDDVHIKVGKANIKLKDYAELVARTMQREAATIGGINRMKANNLELMEITSVNTTIDSCKVFEGLIVSVTGDDDRFPNASILPRGHTPFHPRCRHGMAPRSQYFIEDDEREKKTKIKLRYRNKSFGELQKILRREFDGNAMAMRKHARS